MADEPAGLDSDQWRQVKQTAYEPAAEGELATELIYAVADVKGVDPLDNEQLPVLYDAVDAASLEEALFSSAGTGRGHTSEGFVSFQYVGLTITVESNGWITVYEER